MSRRGVKNTMPSKEVQRQLLRDLTRKSLDGDVQAAEVILNHIALVDKHNSAESHSSNNSTEPELGEHHG